MPIIHVCSRSKVKLTAVEQFAKVLESVTGQSYDITSSNFTGVTQRPSQPYDDETFIACQTRMNEEHIGAFSKHDMVISIENGIFTKNQYSNGKIYDVAVVRIEMLADDMSVEPKFYTSFGIEIDGRLFEIYRTWAKTNQNRTYGEFLATYFGLPHDCALKDPRFGNRDRVVQIQDALYKWLMDVSTTNVPNYPKPGVIFRHITPIMSNARLFNIMFDLLERYVLDNYRVSEIDGFVGIDARGLYFAPTLARKFGKAFIPLRKARKLPITDQYEIITESYQTEYSDDVLGIENNPAYNGMRVIILDDLLATGGTIVAAANLLEKVGMIIEAALTIFDVVSLRDVAAKKLNDANLICNVLIKPDAPPSDLVLSNYEIMEITLDTLRHRIANDLSDLCEPIRKYTHSWTAWDDMNPVDHTNSYFDSIKILSTSKDVLSASIYRTVAELGSTTVSRIIVKNQMFSNGEIGIDLTENIRNCHAVIVSQVRTNHINDDIMELMMIMDACRKSCASKITVVLPYYPYSRADKKDSPRCPIGAAVIANMLTQMGADNIISLDLHAAQIQGFVSKGFHNLPIKNYACDYIFNNYLAPYPSTEWNDRFVLVAPDAGSARNVKKYSKMLQINNIIMDKERDYSVANTVLSSRFVGDSSLFKGKTAIVIDDMADTIGTMVAGVKSLVESGVKDVIILVTHGVLSGPALQRINETREILEVIVTDSLPQEKNMVECPKLRVLQTNELIGRAIDSIVTGRSVSSLFFD